ncbi:unnamed protein product [Schistosoma turkestanicum]|nr:unnamed protein product [Schistosoma turkestanicum]
MSRLPSIDPDTRTIILCGFPNVGKSSFINKITRADVDVQPFPFTTKSLFVGHTDYKNLRWQVIDTPGVLNRPLDEHNTIEMLSITALAHLQAAVVYIMDLSEQCGYTIQQQLKLFQNLRPLFRNKPLVIAANKIDIKPFEALTEEDKQSINHLVQWHNDDTEQLNDPDRPVFVEMSTVTEIGLVTVRSIACDRLLAQRVQAKIRAANLPGSKADISSRLYIAKPKSDENETAVPFRPPKIPDGILEKQRKRMLKRLRIADSLPTNKHIQVDDDDEDDDPSKRCRTMRDRELEADPDEGFILNLREHWSIKHPEEANDIIPEIFNGHNLIDLFDPEIEEKLNALEEQEAALENAGFYDESELLKQENDPEMKKIKVTAAKIREARALRVLESRARKQVRRPQVPRSARSVSVHKIHQDLGELGLEVDMHEQGERGRSLKRAVRSRNSTPNPHREASIARASVSRSRSGLRDDKMLDTVKRMSKIAQRKVVTLARKGEGDRHIPTLKPKHLFSGKRGTGKTDRR